MALYSIQEIFDAFAKLKVLVIGDAMIDTYTYGQVDRISPEAPVPIVKVSGEEHRLGGAANVALNLAQLGIEVDLCCVSGDDEGAVLLTSLLSQKDLDSSGVLQCADRPTTIKKRIVAANGQLLRIDTETDNNLSADQILAFSDQVLSRLVAVDLVIFEDYDKGVISPELITEVISKCKKMDVPVVVDPKFRNFENYLGATLFKPNFPEFSRGTEGFAGRTLVETAKNMKAKFQFENLLLTRSSKGVFYLSDQESGELPAHVRAIADVSGAGDTVAAIAGAALAVGLPLRVVAELANLGGGIVCEYPGVVPIPRKRLFKEARNFLSL